MEGPGPIAGPGKVPLLFIFIPIIGGGPWLPAGAGLNASMQNNLYLELSYLNFTNTNKQFTIFKKPNVQDFKYLEKNIFFETVHLSQSSAFKQILNDLYYPALHNLPHVFENPNLYS